jgi:hypothetical protein
VVIEVGSCWVEGLNLWYVVSDRDVAFCLLVCRRIDFKQLNGRSVGLIEDIAPIS